MFLRKTTKQDALAHFTASWKKNKKNISKKIYRAISLYRAICRCHVKKPDCWANKFPSLRELWAENNNRSEFQTCTEIFWCIHFEGKHKHHQWKKELHLFQVLTSLSTFSDTLKYWANVCWRSSWVIELTQKTFSILSIRLQGSHLFFYYT